MSDKMNPIELSTSFHFPQFQGMLAGMAAAFGKADAEMEKACSKQFNAGYLAAQQECLKLLHEAVEVSAVIALVTIDATPLTSLMSVASWETTEEPVGGHGDDIKWSSGRYPESYDYEESWVKEVFMEHLPEELCIKINEFFAEQDG